MSEFDFDVVTGPAIPLKALTRQPPRADATPQAATDAAPRPALSGRLAEVLPQDHPARAARAL